MAGRMSKTLAIIVGAVVCLLLFPTCGIDPAGPGPRVSTPLKDYPVFFWEIMAGQYFYRYNVVSRRVDSVDLPMNARAFAVSADGSTVYFFGSGPGGLILDAQTFQIQGYLPFPGRPFCSSDGKHIAILGQDINIVRAEDYSLIFHDTDALSHGAFSPNGRRFYGNKGPGECETLYRVDIETHDVSHTCLEPGVVISPIVVSADEREVYLYRQWGTSAQFQVYDRNADSVVFRAPLSPGMGQLLLPRGSHKVLINNPGNRLFTSGPYTFAEYDTRTRQFTSYRIAGGCDEYMEWAIPADIAVTPDGRWLLGADFASGMGLMIYDLVTRDTVRFECVGMPVGFYRLECQSGL